MVKRKRPARYVLMVVAAMLLSSGGLRIAVGAGPAFVMAEETQLQEMEPIAEPRSDEPVSELVAALQAREERVSTREVAIEDRMLALALAEEELSERLAELKAAEESLLATLSLSESANENDILRLTAVYENMKPADAASLFEEMSPDFAAGFLVRMNPQSAAAIMTGLEPQTAYSVSVIIAGRNANAPTE